MHQKDWLAIGLISCVWLVVNLYQYPPDGMHIVADSERYIEYAKGLASGFYFDRHNFWYIGYALFIKFSLDGGSIESVVVFQYILSLIAVLLLYRAAFLLWESRLSAVLCCMLFLLFADISQWNSYILAESIYTSFICFSVYLFVLIYKKPGNWLVVLAAVIVASFATLIKPTGISVLGAVIAVLAFKRPWSIALTAILFLILINKMLTTYLVIENYHNGEIIYGVTTTPGLKDHYNIAGLALTPPEDPYTPPVSYPPAVKIIAFIFHHPFYWTNLFLHKVFYLLFHIRPFWSLTHNLFSAGMLLLSYPAFIMGIRSKMITRDVVILAITFLLIHILSVGITSDDWDGRFLIPMLPVIFIFSGHGLATWRYRKSAQ